MYLHMHIYTFTYELKRGATSMSWQEVVVYRLWRVHLSLNICRGWFQTIPNPKSEDAQIPYIKIV